MSNRLELNKFNLDLTMHKITEQCLFEKVEDATNIIMSNLTATFNGNISLIINYHDINNSVDFLAKITDNQNTVESRVRISPVK